MQKPSNVYRIDIQPSDAFPDRHATHGWQVRIRRSGVQHTKFFSDDKHGGSAKALLASIVYRDELMPTLPEADDPTIKSAQARSKTGVVGLSFCTKDDGSGTQKPYVQLSWTGDNRKRRTASFSVDKWGLRKAIWNACVRLHREREALGQPTESPQEMFNKAHASISKQYPEFVDIQGKMEEADKA